MSDAPASAPHPDQEPADSGGRRSVVNRIILIVVALVVLLLLGLLAVAVVPRWWAQRVGTMVDGRLIIGSAIGIVFGMVFMAAPLVFFGVAARHLRSLKKAVGALLIGLLLAFPNLSTLAIVLGSGSAAHAGQRVLDVDAPGFRGGSLVGALIGAVLGAWVIFLMWSRRRRGRELARLKAEEDERKTAEPPR